MIKTICRYFLDNLWNEQVLINKKRNLHTVCTLLTQTLQDKIFPNAEKVSYNCLLSIVLSKFLMKMLPTPNFIFKSIEAKALWIKLYDLTWFSEGGVTLTPHDTDWFPLDFIKIHRVDRALGVSWLLEVDIGIAQWAACYHVAANSNWKNWPSLNSFWILLGVTVDKLPVRIFRKALPLLLRDGDLRRKDSPSDKTVWMSPFFIRQKIDPPLKNFVWALTITKKYIRKL